ncbi:MAG: hypothetical protein H8E55_65615 [Pelagibacterales bacterium]|nr:hypothetical protein [Pelagibacterales bacterium]
MTKYGLYNKHQSESKQHINTVDIQTKTQAEAYFAGVKQLQLHQFNDLFIVKEIKHPSKQLLFGNK